MTTRSCLIVSIHDLGRELRLKPVFNHSIDHCLRLKPSIMAMWHNPSRQVDRIARIRPDENGRFNESDISSYLSRKSVRLAARYSDGGHARPLLIRETVGTARGPILC